MSLIYHGFFTYYDTLPFIEFILKTPPPLKYYIKYSGQRSYLTFAKPSFDYWNGEDGGFATACDQGDPKLKNYCKMAEQVPDIKDIFNIMKFSINPSKLFIEDKLKLQYGEYKEVSVPDHKIFLPNKKD